MSVKIRSNKVLRINSLARFDWQQNINHTSAYVKVGSAGSVVIKSNPDIYEFSNYILDPNKYRVRTVIRILALVQRLEYKT